MKKLLMFMCSVAMLPLLFAGGVKEVVPATADGSKKYEKPELILRFADIPAESDEMILANKEFARIVNEKTNGRIVIQVYPGSQLGSNNDVFQAVKLGAIDIARMQLPFIADAGNVPLLRVASLPYLFTNYEQEWKALRGSIGQEFIESANKSSANIVGLGYYVPTSRNFFTTKKKVETLGDMKGLKIRVQSSQIYIDMVNCLGASATPLAMSELYSALQTGVVDGGENPVKGYYNDKFYEVAKFYSLSPNDSSEPSMLFISKMTWNKLSETEKKIFMEAANDASLFFQKETVKRLNDYIEKLQASGVIFTQIKDIDRWITAVQPMYATYGKGYEDLIKRIREFK